MLHLLMPFAAAAREPSECLSFLAQDCRKLRGKHSREQRVCLKCGRQSCQSYHEDCKGFDASDLQKVRARERERGTPHPVKSIVLIVPLYCRWFALSALCVGTSSATPKALTRCPPGAAASAEAGGILR